MERANPTNIEGRSDFAQAVRFLARIQHVCHWTTSSEVHSPPYSRNMGGSSYPKQICSALVGSQLLSDWKGL